MWDNQLVLNTYTIAEGKSPTKTQEFALTTQEIGNLINAQHTPSFVGDQQDVIAGNVACEICKFGDRIMITALLRSIGADNHDCPVRLYICQIVGDVSGGAMVISHAGCTHLFNIAAVQKCISGLSATRSIATDSDNTINTTITYHNPYSRPCYR